MKYTLESAQIYLRPLKVDLTNHFGLQPPFCHDLIMNVGVQNSWGPYHSILS